MGRPHEAKGQTSRRGGALRLSRLLLCNFLSPRKFFLLRQIPRGKRHWELEEGAEEYSPQACLPGLRAMSASPVPLLLPSYPKEPLRGTPDYSQYTRINLFTHGQEVVRADLNHKTSLILRVDVYKWKEMCN